MHSCRIILSSSAIALFALGLLMVFNTSSAHIMDHFLAKDHYDLIFKQLMFCLLGTFIGLMVYSIGYEKILNNSFYLYLLTLLLLIAVFIPGFGMQIKGAKRWISFFGFSFQPSEFAKYTIPLYFLYLISYTEKLSFKSFVTILGVVFIPFFLIFIEPDNGSCFIILITLLLLFILTKIPFTYWALPLLFIVFFGAIGAYHMPHVPGRIKIYLHPESDLKGRGHQPFQAKIATGSGRLLGKGLGKSMQKYSYLPEARSDYIAAIFAEEFGFIGMLFLIGLYMTFLFCGYTIAMKCEDKIAFNLAFLLCFIIAFQAFLNLGIVSGLLPSKGTTLPFVSQGGSSLMMNIIATCVLLNVSKKTA